MKKLSPPLLMLLLLNIAQPYALAHDGQVNITGSIQDNTCTLITSEQTVNMTSIGLKHVDSGDALSQPVKFTIDLKDCGTKATGVSVTFNGNQDNDDSSLLALSASDTTARHVAIAIMDVNKQLIPLRQTSSVYTLQQGVPESPLDFYAQYIATSSDVSTGAANAESTFILTYQ